MGTTSSARATPNVGPRLVAPTLSAASGFVDAAIFLGVRPVFVANQSGNVVLAGMAIGQGRLRDAAEPLAAVAGYVVGAAGIVAAAGDPARRRTAFIAATAAGSVTLVVLAAAVAFAAAGARPSRLVGLGLLIFIGGAAGSQGAQAVAVRSESRVPVLTTGETGNLTRLGVLFGRSTRRSMRASTPMVVLGAVVLAYLLGAAAAAALQRLHAPVPALLLGAAGVVAIVAMSQWR